MFGQDHIDLRCDETMPTPYYRHIDTRPLVESPFFEDIVWPITGIAPLLSIGEPAVDMFYASETFTLTSSMEENKRLGFTRSTPTTALKLLCEATEVMARLKEEEDRQRAAELLLRCKPTKREVARKRRMEELERQTKHSYIQAFSSYADLTPKYFSVYDMMKRYPLLDADDPRQISDPDGVDDRGEYDIELVTNITTYADKHYRPPKHSEYECLEQSLVAGFWEGRSKWEFRCTRKQPRLHASVAPEAPVLPEIKK